MTTWKLFVLGRDKTPLPNCKECANAGPKHDREACDHLVCHGFYAATDDLVRQQRMHMRAPDGHWAVRTGAASGIVVLDAEGVGSPSGNDVLDDWENWSGGWPLADTDRIALTPSGGTHRYYRYEHGIRSRNRVLPGIDVKSDGGYVVVPHDDPSRRWLREGEPGVLEGKMLEWFRLARGRGARSEGNGIVGHADGYDYQRFVRDGCPGGMRDEFFNELIFRLRKSGMELNRIYEEAHRHWKRAAQPPDAAYYMPFHHVEYKIKRIWGTVEVEDVTDELRTWAEAQVGEPVKVGRATMVRRES